MPRLTRLFSNLLFLVGGEVLARLASFAAIAYLARVLGAPGFGTLAFAGALVSCFALGVSFGLDLYGAREVARDPGAVRAYLARIQSLRLLLGVGGYAALSLAVVVLPLPPEVRLVVLLYGFALFAVAGNAGWALQGLERMAGLAVANLVGQLTLLAGVLLFVRTAGDLSRAALVYVGAETTSAIVLLVLLGRAVHGSAPAPQAGSWRASLAEALPLFAGKAMRTLALNVDVLVLTFYLGDARVGFYSAASRIVLFLLNTSGLYFANLYPTLARASRWEPAAARALLERSLRFTAIGTVPVAVGGAVLAPGLVRLAFGPDYGAAAVPLGILVVAVAVTGVSGNYRNVLIAFDHQRADTRNVSGGALVTVLLNLLLVPPLGTAGAAIAFVAGEILVLCLGDRAVRRLGVAPGLLRPLARPAAAALAMAVVLVAMPPGPVLLQIATGAIVYVAAILAVGGTSAGELKAILFRPALAPREPVGRAEPPPPPPPSS